MRSCQAETRSRVNSLSHIRLTIVPEYPIQVGPSQQTSSGSGYDSVLIDIPSLKDSVHQFDTNMLWNSLKDDSRICGMIAFAWIVKTACPSTSLYPSHPLTLSLCVSVGASAAFTTPATVAAHKLEIMSLE